MSASNHDPESCIQDGDHEMAALEQAGNTVARLQRKGICLHTWVQAPAFGEARCLNCGKTWPNSAMMAEEQEELRNKYL